jgi:hypothetical protein
MISFKYFGNGTRCCDPPVMCVCCVRRDASRDSRTRPSMSLWRPLTHVVKNVPRSSACRRVRRAPRNLVRSVMPLGPSRTRRSTSRISTTMKTRHGGSLRRCSKASSTPTRSTLPSTYVSTHTAYIWTQSDEGLTSNGSNMCTCLPRPCMCHGAGLPTTRLVFWRRLRYAVQGLEWQRPYIFSGAHRRGGVGWGGCRPAVLPNGN